VLTITFLLRLQLFLLQGTNLTSDAETLLFQNQAETLLLGFPKFPNINNLSSITLEQAENRVQYAALDIWRDADGTLLPFQSHLPLFLPIN
jgi:hypothetical protein